LVPLLAAGQPSISADGKNYTIELRQGISFHDDTPFNASCVKWNVERAMKIFVEWSAIGHLADVLQGGAQVKEAALSNGTESSIFRITFDDWVANSGAIEVLDVYTIRFVLEEAFSPFVTMLATGAAFVMSPTYAILHAASQALATWEAYGVDYGDYENYMDTHTCGTGPYMLFEGVPDQYIELTFFDNYWRATETASEISPPSYAGSIRRVFIRTNDDAIGRKLNLRTGTVDGVYWPYIDLSEIWDTDEGTTLDPDIHVSTGGYQYVTTFFGFNMGNLTTTINSSIVTTGSPFRNKHFRRSTSFAFNYSEFIDVSYNNIGIQGRGPIPMGMLGYNGSSFTFDYNISAAVEEWNLAMQDPEFVLSLNSINCSLIFYYIEGSTLKHQSVNLLQQGLEDVFWHPMANHTGLNHNMTTMIEELPYPVHSQYRTEGRLPVEIYGWIPDYADPISYLNPLCYSKGVMAQKIGYNNTDIDMWCDLVISETDPVQRQVYFNHIQDTIADEAPYLWAYQGVEFRTWRNWTSGDGLIFNPMRDIYFYHIIKNLPAYPTQNLPIVPFFAEEIFVLLLAYVIVNHFISPTLLRKRFKFALLAIYTGLALCFTAWSVFILFFTYLTFPFGLILIPSLGLLWAPWCFIYSDYMGEVETIKPPQPTIDL
jgi:peptide/nickel transport system substrate-binding protein